MPPLLHNLSRLYRWAAQPLYRSPIYNWSLGNRSNGEFASFEAIDWPDDRDLGARLLADEFRFGSEILRQPKPIGNPPGASLAWRTYLHGYQWLDQLKALDGPAARAKARQIIEAWLVDHSAYDAIAWRADILADRLHRLLVSHAFLDMNNDALFRARLLFSMNREIRHLARVLPDGRMGADLLKAAISLLLASTLMPNAAALEAAARKLFDQEIRRQILADGGHIERSPALMVDLLRRLLDLRSALVSTRRQLPNRLVPTITRLAGAVAMMCHGDGDLAAFNDSAEGDRPIVRQCLSLAEEYASDLQELPITGYQRLSAGKSIVIVDCGQQPPSGLDRHAHAGTAALEFSHASERIIVNCGAHPNSIEWRRAQRATAAHSTLIVDDTNSSVLVPGDEYDDGGVALGPAKVTFRRELTPIGILVEVMHDGYANSFGLVHVRRLLLTSDGEELAGEDHLLGKAGGAFVLRFHLHPDVRAVVTQNGQAALLKPLSGAGWRMRMQGGDLALASSVYMMKSGQVRRTQQLIVLGHIVNDRTLVKWSLQREGRRK